MGCCDSKVHPSDTEVAFTPTAATYDPEWCARARVSYYCRRPVPAPPPRRCPACGTQRARRFRNGNAEALREWLAKKEDVNQQDVNGFTVTHLACVYKQVRQRGRRCALPPRRERSVTAAPPPRRRRKCSGCYWTRAPTWIFATK